jgi:acyl transferase domain-containing protein
MDPQQRLLLEVTWEALENAGQTLEGIAGGQTGVFIGISNSDYLHLQLAQTRIDDSYTETGNRHSFAAGRLSYFFDLRGPSIALDTVCSSSLVAVHLACQSLRAQEATMAIVGAVNLILSPTSTAMAAHLHALSPDGKCRTFDAQANGFVRGEGCGVLVLKRLSDALAAHDPILALIRGSAVNQDGHSAGLTAPNLRAQQALLRQALANAGVEASQVSYVETHGTGTALGDPIEVEALRAVLGQARAQGRPCVLGAVKTNVGHLEAAAGMAGLIKAVLCLQHEQIPANVHFRILNPGIQLQDSPLVIPTHPVAWPAREEPRYAGVSAFGLSGTNAHVILEDVGRARSVAAAESASGTEGPFLLPLSARSPEALDRLVGQWQAFLQVNADNPQMSVQHMCYTASVRRSHHQHRLAILCHSREELAEGLQAFLQREARVGCVSGQAAQGRRRKVVFIFPGQGSQWAGMAQELLMQEPVFRATLTQCARMIQACAGWSLCEELAADPQRSRLDQIEIIQPALFAIQVSLAALWRSWGIEPDAVVGHSMGEIAAACVAGVLTLEDAVRTICLRSQLLKRVEGQGAMAVVELSLQEAQRALDGYADRLSVAANNSARSTVLSGDPAALACVLEAQKKQGTFCQWVKVGVAAHSPQVEPLCADLVAALGELHAQAGTLPIYSTVTGTLSNGQEFDTAYWARNLREPVLFSAALTALLATNHDTFIEISPHPILLSSTQEEVTSAGHSGIVLASQRRDEEGRATMLEALATLYVHGCPVEWDKFYPAGGRCVLLPNYPWQREPLWVDCQESAAETQEQRVQRSADSQRTAYAAMASWLYTLQWQPAPSVSASLPKEGHSGSWLLFMDNGNAGQHLRTLLEARGEQCILISRGRAYRRETAERYQVCPTQPAEFERVLRAALGPAQPPCRGIVHLWGTDAVDLEQATLQRTQEEGCASVLHLVQALARIGWRDAPRLWIVTRGAQAVENARPPSVAQAPLWGLGRVIAYEHAELHCTLVDLSTTGSMESDSALLYQELWTNEHETQVALRGENRYVARLVHSHPAQDLPAQAMLLHPDGIYLITGGLGEVGLSVARWMVKRGARSLVLVDEQEASTEVKEALSELEEAHIVIVRTDISDYEHLSRTLAERAGTLFPLRGIVHCAEARDHDPLLRLDWQRFQAVMNPKVSGAWNLHLLTIDQPLDFFVLFSSTASLLGSPNQGSYAAANAFLDALAHHRRAQGLPALCINWSAWSMDGLATSLSAEAYLGIAAMPSVHAFETLQYLLDLNVVQAGALLFNVRQWCQSYPKAAMLPLFATLLREPDHFYKATNQESSVRASLLAAEPAQRRSVLETHLLEQIASVLRLGRARLGPQTPLGTLGFDSLRVVELRNRLEVNLGLTLPATLLWAYPTVATLAVHLAEKMNIALDEKASPEIHSAQTQDEGALDDYSEEQLIALLAHELADAHERGSR